MTASAHAPAALGRLFHEPSRLAILSALCAARDGLSFTELRDACRLTDGNLSRHLKALEEDGVVKIRKAFIDDKPRTTVALTRDGLTRFSLYLDTLSSVLQDAKRAARQEQTTHRNAHPLGAHA